MVKVLLTAENIKDADEFVDGDGDLCKRQSNGKWSWFSAEGIATDDELGANIGRFRDMRGAYVKRWKPGRGPMKQAPHEDLSRDDVRAILKMYRRDAITMDAALDAICWKVQR